MLGVCMMLMGMYWEWCQDIDGLYTDDVKFNQNGSTFKVLRGGWWGPFAGLCRSSIRIIVNLDFKNSSAGLRLIRLYDEQVTTPLPNTRFKHQHLLLHQLKPNTPTSTFTYTATSTMTFTPTLTPSNTFTASAGSD